MSAAQFVDPVPLVCVRTGHRACQMCSVSLNRSESVLRVAEAQFGVISRSQIRELGLRDSSVRRRIDSLRLVPVYPGVYAVGHGRLTQSGRWMAAVLAGGPCAALSHRSAAALWGMITPPATIEILRSSSPDHPNSKLESSGVRFRQPLVIHRSRRFGPRELDSCRGIRVTTVARTLLDLAGVMTERQLDSAFTEADRLGIVDFPALERTLEHGNGWKGIAKLRRVVHSWDPATLRTRSQLERDFLSLCRDHGIPSPSVNVQVAGLEVDCFWPAKGLIVELDGYRFHRSPLSLQRDHARTILLEDAGYRVVRLTYRMVNDEADSTARLVKRRLAPRRT